jgi:NADH-quinone oxidoreductase subunit J
MTSALLTQTSPSLLSPSGVEIAFILFGLIALGSALLVVGTRNLVHAALWLVVTLGSLAVEYLLLTAEFVAWVQVLVYVGAVVVLLLFGLMLTRAPIGVSEDANSGNWRLALGVALAAAAALVTVVVDGFGGAYLRLPNATTGATQATGSALFRHWVLPFEALSVLLLAALIGAIVLSRRDVGAPEPETGGAPAARADLPAPSRADAPSVEPASPPTRGGGR